MANAKNKSKTTSKSKTPSSKVKKASEEVIVEETPEPTLETSEPILSETEAPVEEESSDDDALALKVLSDEQIEAAEDYAVFKQEDGMVAWSLENFYQEDGSIRSKKQLRLDPPVLRVQGSEGQAAEFVLTKGFTKSLSEGLNDVYRGLFGIHKTKKRFGNFREALWSSIVENPLRFVTLLAFFGLCLALIIWG